MYANLRWKDVYPVALFIVLLMTWALVGTSRPMDPIEPLPLSEVIRQPEVKDSCRDDLWPLINKPVCEYKESKGSISPLLLKENFKQLLSQADRKSKH